MRKLRLAKGWTLAHCFGERSGMPLSTLSKLELGKVSLSYEKLMRLCKALDVDLERFVRNEADQAPPAVGRRAVIRSDGGERARFGVHEAEIAATDLLAKAFTPAILTLEAATLAEHGPLLALSGDVYLMFLDGSEDLHTDVYAPLKLRVGDAVYFDGRAPHAILASGADPTRVLLIAAGDGLTTL